MRMLSAKRIRRLATIVLPVLLLTAGCDSVDPASASLEQNARAHFDATAMWPSYGEDIHGVGTHSFHYRTVQRTPEQVAVLVRPADIEAAFTGVKSGDAYAQAWLEPAGEWRRLAGQAGTLHVISETIVLINGRTGEAAEGLVVTEAKITSGGGIEFQVQKVIPLP